jgi:hypothetical protein
MTDYARVLWLNTQRLPIDTIVAAGQVNFRFLLKNKSTDIMLIGIFYTKRKESFTEKYFNIKINVCEEYSFILKYLLQFSDVTPISDIYRTCKISPQSILTWWQL